MTETTDALAKFFSSVIDSFIDHGDDMVDEVKEALVVSGLGVDAGYGASRGEYLGVALTELGASVRGSSPTDFADVE